MPIFDWFMCRDSLHWHDWHKPRGTEPNRVCVANHMTVLVKYRFLIGLRPLTQLIQTPGYHWHDWHNPRGITDTWLGTTVNCENAAQTIESTMIKAWMLSVLLQKSRNNWSNCQSRCKLVTSCTNSRLHAPKVKDVHTEHESKTCWWLCGRGSRSVVVKQGARNVRRTAVPKQMEERAGRTAVPKQMEERAGRTDGICFEVGLGDQWRQGQWIQPVCCRR